MVKGGRKSRERSRSSDREETTTQHELDLAAAFQASTDILLLQTQQAGNSQMEEIQLPPLTQPEEIEQQQIKIMRRKRSKIPARKSTADTQ